MYQPKTVTNKIHSHKRRGGKKRFLVELEHSNPEPLTGWREYSTSKPSLSPNVGKLVKRVKRGEKEKKPVDRVKRAKK